MSSDARNTKLKSFLDRYGLTDNFVERNRVVRLISNKCGIDFDLDPRDNLHLVGIFNPREHHESDLKYVVSSITPERRELVNAQTSLREQWSIFIDILETDFKHYLEGRF